MEGAELDVLRSGRDVLKDSIATIYIEINDDERFVGSFSPLTIFKYLMSMGFLPTSRDSQFPGTYNVLFVQEDIYSASFSTIANYYTNQKKWADGLKV